MLMTTKVVWNIDFTVMLNLLFWQFLLRFHSSHYFNGVVMTFVV